VVTPGGGYGVLAADLVESPDSWPQLAMADLSAHTEARLETALPAFASARNPVDITASATDDMFLAALEAVLDDPGVDMVLCVALFAPPGITDALVERIAALAREHGKPLVLVAQRGADTNQVLRRFYAEGAIGFPSTFRGVRALRALWERTLLLRRIGGKA
jgi:acyl-CoA synthetase (NDP forming)